MRQKGRHRALAKLRRSVPNFWQDANPRHDTIKGNVFMFYEDVKTQIMPWTYTHEGARWKALVTPDTRESRERIMTCLRACTETPGYEASDHVFDFVRTAASRLALFSGTVYEKVRVDEEVALFPLPPGRILQFGAGCVQLIPPRTARETGKSTVWLPRQNVWHLRLPMSLGNIAGVWWTQRVLLSADSLPPAWLYSSLEAREEAGFQLSAFVRESQLAVARATNRWSWPARRLMRENMTYFHQIHREMMFRRCLAALREHVIRGLNGVLSDVGLHINLVGVPTARRIDELLVGLRTGALTPAAVVKETNLFAASDG